MKHCCKLMDLYVGMEESSMSYYPKYREYGISVIGEKAYHRISHCPWCGKKLPESLNDQWFEIMFDMFEDLDGYADPRIPEEFKTDEWWKKRGL